MRSAPCKKTLQTPNAKFDLGEMCEQAPRRVNHMPGQTKFRMRCEQCLMEGTECE